MARPRPARRRPSTSSRRRSTPPASVERTAQLAVEVGGGEVGVLEHAVDERADARAARHRRQRKRDRLQPRPLGILGGRRDRRAGEVDLLVVGPGDLGLARRPPVPWPPTSARCRRPTPRPSKDRSNGRTSSVTELGASLASSAGAAGPLGRSIADRARRLRGELAGSGRRPRSSSGATSSSTASGSRSAANRSRASGDWRLSHVLAQCSTVWWRARVSAT